MHLPAQDTPSSDSSVSDLVAVDEVLRGNREMFEVLVRRHNQQLFRIGMACLQHREQVEDAMQNAYLKAYLHLAKFRRDAAFSTWLTRIMINECRMALRKRRSSREESGAENNYTTVPDANTPAPGQNLTLNEMKTLLEHAISQLSVNHRKVYVLREVQQLSTAETASCLGVSVESVKVTLHRAREQLKNRLLASAAGPELFQFHAPRCNGLTAKVMRAVLAIRK
jgi:RNA polymerase sigma-70 factor (ECF subfamily)